jgi:uncharacterized membrane protein
VWDRFGRELPQVCGWLLSRRSFCRRSRVIDTNVTQVAPAPAARLVLPRPRLDRLDSIDLLRGVVMVLMALDHVRDFFSDQLFVDPTDLQKTTPPIFLTRWVTHFCAPTFMFLAGTAAFLSGTRGKSRPALSWFLFTRGLWLAFLEVVVNRILWMFNFDLQHHGAGVFWAIGWSMVVLSVLVYLPATVVTLLGVGMIGLHNLLDGLTADQVHLPGWLWVILHSPGDAPVMDEGTVGQVVNWARHLLGLGDVSVVDGITFGTGYCLVPWMGVMAAGYGFGTLLQLDRPQRRRRLFLLGTALTLGFVLLRAANVYGDPHPWAEQSSPLLTFLSFLNCTKYPPSLLYLLMTLGPAILALAFFDRPLGPLARPIVTFGRVPLFFYLLHIPLIHGGAVLCDTLRFGWSPLAAAGPWEIKPGAVPEHYGLSLPLVYVVWIGVVLVLYLPCRWFAEVKRRRRDGWLSYI